MIRNKLIKKIQHKKAIIGIFGLGYVGLPLTIMFVNAGFKVIGFDTNKNKVEVLNSGKSYINDIDDADIKKIKKNNFFATDNFSDATKIDIIIICVPTPLNDHREPNLEYVKNTLSKLSPYLRSEQLLSLESTTYPGTTREIVLPVIESVNLKIGYNFFVIYSPERIDPGNKFFKTQQIPKIVGGITDQCCEIGHALYEQSVQSVIKVSSTETAEMTKLLENIYRSVNIGLVNEMKIICDAMKIDIHEVIKAASTKPFGFTPFVPGPGLGGHCIPIDPFYLTWKAKEYGLNSRFIELAGEVNTKMPHWVIQKISDILNNMGKSIKGSKILILGIAYKKNIDDMRESPAVVIMDILSKKGAKINYSDPHILKFPKIRKYSFNLDSVILTPKKLEDFDIIILTTDHDSFDYELILKHGKVIVDTRGVFENKNVKVYKA